MDFELNGSLGSRNSKCEQFLRNVATKRGVRMDDVFVGLGGRKLPLLSFSSFSFLLPPPPAFFFFFFPTIGMNVNLAKGGQIKSNIKAGVHNTRKILGGVRILRSRVSA